MKFTKLPMEGLVLVENRAFHDQRGFFTERYRSDLFAAHGIPEVFVQDNFSWSRPGVIRGLHFQSSPAQGKLVTCVSGEILDVAVDVRAGSPTFGQHFSVLLNSENPMWLWVPAGFAHGFSVTGGNPAHVLYKVNCGWGPGGEGGIKWDDPELGINWKVKTPVLSEKDKELQSFSAYREEPKFIWKNDNEATC